MVMGPARVPHALPMIEISPYYIQNTIEHPKTITLLFLKSINTLRKIFSINRQSSVKGDDGEL